jgi:hypothetical protein
MRPTRGALAKAVRAGSGLVMGVASACGGDGPTPPRSESDRAIISITGPATLAQGATTTFTVSIELRDATEYRGRFQVEVSGAYRMTTVLAVQEAHPGFSAVTVPVTVPREANDGPLLIVATAMDVADARPDTARLQVLDTVLPSFGWYLTSLRSARGEVTLAENAVWLGIGDVNQLTVGFLDNHAVRWLGYRLGPPVNVADSVPPRGSSLFFPGDAVPTDTASFGLHVAESWLGTSPHLVVFARDERGNLAQVDYGPTPIGRWRDHPTRTLTLGDSASDVAIDEKRQLLYVSVPSARQIAVVDPAGPALRGTIAAPASPGGVDITLSGDSLYVALENRAALGVVDLTRAPLVMDTVPIGIDTVRKKQPFDDTAYLAVWPDRLRIASNGRVVISTTWPPNTMPFESRIVVFDPASKTTDRYSRGAMWHQAVGRSADRSRVVIGDGLNDFALYDPSQNTVQLVPGGADGPVSLTANGNLVLAWGILHDRSLATLRALGDSRSYTKATVLQQDGSMAILAARQSPVYYGYRVADGFLAERGSLPFQARYLALTTDGTTLVVLGENGVALMDLTR